MSPCRPITQLEQLSTYGQSPLFHLSCVFESQACFQFQYSLGFSMSLASVPSDALFLCFSFLEPEVFPFLAFEILKLAASFFFFPNSLGYYPALLYFWKGRESFCVSLVCHINLNLINFF